MRQTLGVFWVPLSSHADIQEFATCILILDADEFGQVFIYFGYIFGHVLHDFQYFILCISSKTAALRSIFLNLESSGTGRKQSLPP